MAGARALGESGGGGVAAMDYSVHEAWNEATNNSNKRKIMRIFTLPPTVEIPPEPNFYDSMKKLRLRQQLEMYSIARKYDHQQQPQKQTDSLQLLVE